MGGGYGGVLSRDPDQNIIIIPDPGAFNPGIPSLFLASRIPLDENPDFPYNFQLESRSRRPYPDVPQNPVPSPLYR